jgi:hypothetical protein
MRSRIASLLGLPPPVDSADIVRRDELGRFLGVPQSQALELTRRPEFPEPMFSLHRRQRGETLPQPQPLWERAELERWVKQQTATR